jgi:hypothetical protein
VGGLGYFGFLFTLFILSFSFLCILVCGGYYPFIFISKTNKPINMQWIFCMMFLVVDHFCELHFSHWRTPFSQVNIFFLFFSFFFLFSCITNIFFSTHVGCDGLVVDLLVVVFGAYHCYLFIHSSWS